MSAETLPAYNQALSECQDLFFKKNKDYGEAWHILRAIAIVEQIFIKAWRIRTIQEKKQQKISDSIDSEFIGIINYALIGLIQEQRQYQIKDFSPEELQQQYQSQSQRARTLFEQKNHDYGEAWRALSPESIVDLILMKLERSKKIIRARQALLVSEGLSANYLDIINYAIFARIKIQQL